VVGLSAGDVNERPLSRAATEIPRALAVSFAVASRDRYRYATR